MNPSIEIAKGTDNDRELDLIKRRFHNSKGLLWTSNLFLYEIEIEKLQQVLTAHNKQITSTREHCCLTS